MPQLYCAECNAQWFGLDELSTEDNRIFPPCPTCGGELTPYNGEWDVVDDEYEHEPDDDDLPF